LVAKEGRGIRLSKETIEGGSKVPRSKLAPLTPQQMRCFDEVCKDLDGYIAL